jgi:type VI secretion system protein ImpA
MVSLDLETLLAPVSPEAPCGPNLDEESAFYTLVEASRCLPKDRIVGPNEPSDEPNWREISNTSQGLFGRTKDVRIASTLAKAQLRLSGVVGYCSCIQLIRELLDRYWDGVHPVLDPSDGDATMRLNAIRELCDRQSVLSALRAVPIVSVPALGSFSFKDITSDPTNNKIEAALTNCDLSHLQQLTAALQTGLSDLGVIEARVTDKLGSQHTLRFDELVNLLEQMSRLLVPRLQARAGMDAGAEQANDMNHDGLTLEDNGPSAVKATGPNQIRTRADVQRTLDLLCAYYDRNEPSSPVPILLKRARRLSAMSFMEIVRDLTPGGTAELEVIRGPREADKT